MELIDTLITARWVIPIEPVGTVLERHAIAIRSGRICAVLPEKQAFARFSADQVVNRGTHVLLPGFINTHIRAAAALLRDSMPSPMQPAVEQRWLDPEYVRDGTELAIAGMLTSGTTCFADTHLYADIVARTAADAKIRACIGAVVDDDVSAWAGSADEYFEKGLRLHDEYRDDPLIATLFAPVSPSIGDTTLRRVQRLADELELPVSMPLNAVHGDNDRLPERVLARLERLGLLSPLFTAVHMVHVDADDLDRAARGGIHIAHCPRENLRHGNGVAPLGVFRERGLNVALGTGRGDTNLIDEMRVAALLASGIDQHQFVADDRDIGAHDWLQIATLNGARALGLADQIGSLMPGKWADLCCIDLQRPQTQPVHDPAARIVYAASREQVTDVWVAGRALVTNGELTQLDLDDVLRRAQLWQERISGARDA